MKFTKADRIRVLTFAIIGWTAIIIGYYILKPKDKLPIINPADINPELVDSTLKNVKHNHRTGSFTLLNQFGDTVTERTLENKIFVTDFFFTTCPNICLDMSKNLAKIHEEFKDDTTLLLLSHTVQPEKDSVTVLYEYAQRYGATDKQWQLLTGDKKVIYDLARKSYFVVTTKGDGGKSDFIHTENFVLVDTKKRIRGFYDGTNDDDMEKLVRDIGILQKEIFK